MDYPKMLFKAGGTELCHGLECETMVVENEEQEGHAIDEGYALTPQEAHGEKKAAKKGGKPDPEIKALEEHIAKLDAALVEANKRIEAAEKRATDAEEGHARVTDALAAKADEVERLTKQIDDLTDPKSDKKAK